MSTTATRRRLSWRDALDETIGELEAIERLSQSAKAAAAQGDPAWTAIAQGGNASVAATAKLKPQLIQQYPELADMSAKRINQIMRDAVRGR